MTQALPAGWFSEGDIRSYRALYEAVPECGVTAEAGVFLGRSLCSVADIIVHKRIHVYALDTFGDEPVAGGGALGAHLGNFRRAMRDFAIWGNCQILMGRFADTVDDIPDASLDLTFIDGSHDVESVREDLRLFAPKVKPGGVMAGHDWNYPSVQKAVWEFSLDVMSMPDVVWAVRK